MANFTRPILTYADVPVPAATANVQIPANALNLNVSQLIQRIMITESAWADNALFPATASSFLSDLSIRWWIRGRTESTMLVTPVVVAGDPIFQCSQVTQPAVPGGLPWYTMYWKPTGTVTIARNATMMVEWLNPSTLNAAGVGTRIFLVAMRCHGATTNQYRLLHQNCAWGAGAGGGIPGFADVFGTIAPGQDATNRYGEDLILDSVRICYYDTFAAPNEVIYNNHVRVGLHIEGGVGENACSKWLTWNDSQNWPCITGYGMDMGLPGRSVVIDLRDNPMEISGSEQVAMEFTNLNAATAVRAQIIVESLV